ncbi:MAG: hypothetical protein KA003_15365 [Caldilineaceae bacterium]|nr:hypothetical protein [Caldilineaceae bacterium]MBP8110547.1 hypothetical protein [Caldilineaceae bacterium]MBP8124840.1 hypothetical protein [Caldilineaceae bacterium]
MNRAYKVPMRALWLSNADLIELRILTTCKADPERNVRHWINVHLGDQHELLGVSVIDNRLLHLGQWLRQTWDEVPLDDDGPVFNRVAYDEGGQIAYFGLVGKLPDEVIQAEGGPAGATIGNVVQRRADLRFSAEGLLCSIRIPVESRRRKDGDLSVTVGYLPQR